GRLARTSVDVPVERRVRRPQERGRRQARRQAEGGVTVPDERFTSDDRHEVAVSEEEAAASELEADLARLSQLQSERDEYLDTLRRVQAEFENYRKRVIKEQTALVDRATEGLVEQLLPVLDSFELALKNFDRSEEHTSELQSPDHLVC